MAKLTKIANFGVLYKWLLNVCQTFARVTVINIDPNERMEGKMGQKNDERAWTKSWKLVKIHQNV